MKGRCIDWMHFCTCSLTSLTLNTFAKPDWALGRAVINFLSKNSSLLILVVVFVVVVVLLQCQASQTACSLGVILKVLKISIICHFASIA